MKELTLIRHAKSDWADAGLDDHDRPLNDRGRRDAPRMAAALAARGLRPDLMVTSTALRAETTARLVADGLEFPAGAIRREAGLYLARPDEILRVVQGLEETAGSAVLFGHNPGIHEAAYLLLKPADAVVLTDFPTCAVARIRLPDAFWGAVGYGQGELVDFLFPKGLEA
ncbi:MAG: histidine phosphatase family protein [Verrucomicrobiales bacterium]|nr:histidine phosphatase family protein [Verrucomicrobiales bacterium]